MTADRAQPCEQRRFAAERLESVDPPAEGRLCDLLRRVAPASHARQRETVDAGKVAFEELLEGPLLSREHPFDQVAFDNRRQGHRLLGASLGE